LGYLAFGGATSWKTLEQHFVEVRKDHAELIDAYEAHDPDAAERIAGRHVLLFRNRIFSFLTDDTAGSIDLGGNILPSMQLPGSNPK
jgi:DNA-binding FadR family transcriptional regulator